MLSLFKRKRTEPARSEVDRTPAPVQSVPPSSSPEISLTEALQGYTLPSFPQTVMSALRMFKDPNASLTDIGNQLERDPGVSVRVLKMVNSAAFGLRKNVGHVGHAISLLGRARVEALVVSVAVRDMLPVKNTSYFSSSDFWLLAARRASLARALADHLHPGTSTESFTAGLLQDMAIPVLIDLHKERYGNLYAEYAEKGGKSLVEAERTYFGFDHANLGKMMARKWQLPPKLIDAIAGHHGTVPGAASDPAVAFVADIRPGDTPETLDHLVEAGIAYGISAETMADMIPQAFADAQEFYQALR